MRRNIFKRREVDYGCYMGNSSSSYIILVLDFHFVLIVGSHTYKLNEFKMRLTIDFKIMNQGDAKFKKVISMMKSTNKGTKLFITKKLKLGMASTALPSF